MTAISGRKSFASTSNFRRNPVQLERPVIFQEIFFFLEPSDAFGSFEPDVAVD